MARRGSLTGISNQDLQLELRRRQKRVGSLGRRRDRLAEKLATLDSQIADLGGSIDGRMGVRKRPRNEMNLVQSLAKMLDGKTMGVSEVAEAVQKAGYKTTSPSFRTIVNQALINHSNLFKRVGRGQYTHK